MAAWRKTLAPWAGGVAGPLVWWVHQRSLADPQVVDCHVGGVAGRLIWSLVLIAALAVAAWLSLSVWRRWPPHESEPDNRRFIALVSVGVAGLLGLAVIFGTMASIIVPDCYR
jgi:hypothetical protein